MSARLVDNAGVAAMLGVTPRWWRGHKKSLYQAGFPRPVPGFESIGLHDGHAIERWLDGHLPGAACASQDRAGAEDQDPWAARLDRNARNLARSH